MVINHVSKSWDDPPSRWWLFTRKPWPNLRTADTVTPLTPIPWGRRLSTGADLTWMVVDAWNPAENIASWNGVCFCFSFQHETKSFGFFLQFFLLPKNSQQKWFESYLSLKLTAVWPPGFHGDSATLETQQLPQVRGCGDLVVPNWTLWGSKWKLAKRITSSSWRCGFWRFSLENWWVLFSHNPRYSRKWRSIWKGSDEGSHFWYPWFWEEVQVTGDHQLRWKSVVFWKMFVFLGVNLCVFGGFSISHQARA